MATEGSGTATPVTVDGESRGRGDPAKLQTPVAASASPRVLASRNARTVEELLFEEGFAFDFFQAVRILERLDKERQAVGHDGPPHVEAVRFRAHLSLSFPPSSIYEVERPTANLAVPAMTVTFLGLTGPNGVLPRHYTELLIKQREARTDEKYALRDWFDLFNHRVISLFYRAWEKYRFCIPYERGEYAKREPDTFTQTLFSLSGLGTPALRNRLRIVVRETPAGEVEQERVLGRINDLALLYYSGHLSHRPRSASALESVLRDYFELPIAVQQFRGQWLPLDQENQSALTAGSNNQLGANTIAGDRVWDVQSKFRLRLGPLGYNQFTEFLPDRAPVPERKSVYLLAHLARLYVGPELDFDIQIVLRAADVPECRLDSGERGARLGWNTWIRSQPMSRDAEDAVFAAEEPVFLN